MLIIDDDPFVRRFIVEGLQRAGHEAIEAEDGLIGVQRLEEFRIDLVLTDLIMPNQEGIATIVAIRQRSPRLPIIAFTGGGRTRNYHFLEIAKSAGATAVLSKPFDYRTLLNAVSGCLEAPPPSQ